MGLTRLRPLCTSCSVIACTLASRRPESAPIDPTRISPPGPHVHGSLLLAATTRELSAIACTLASPRRESTPIDPTMIAPIWTTCSGDTLACCHRTTTTWPCPLDALSRFYTPAAPNSPRRTLVHLLLVPPTQTATLLSPLWHHRATHNPDYCQGHTRSGPQGHYQMSAPHSWDWRKHSWPVGPKHATINQFC
jgi:hypothetical protein